MTLVCNGTQDTICETLEPTAAITQYDNQARKPLRERPSVQALPISAGFRLLSGLHSKIILG